MPATPRTKYFPNPKCARGEGHPVAVLAVGYPGGVIRQISLPQEKVVHIGRCLANYHKLKAALEKICELNQQLLHPPPYIRASASGSTRNRP
jgi:hypothetical protein